eukprot:3741509-Rhodomonas_salina.1
MIPGPNRRRRDLPVKASTDESVTVSRSARSHHWPGHHLQLASDFNFKFKYRVKFFSREPPSQQVTATVTESV